jgi:hypothetical protein
MVSENIDKDSSDTNTPSNSFPSKEFEELFFQNLTDRDASLYSGNRVLGVLADFFYDDNTARDYERGILLKGGRHLKGKTIVLSRNKINHLLTANCEVSGMGTYRVSYATTWTAKAEYEEIDKLLKDNTQRIDIVLCRLLKSQERWKYIIVDLEKNENRDEMLLGR